MNTKQGQSLVELLVAIAIFALILPALLVGFVTSRDNKPQQLRKLEAVQVLKQTQEGLRSVRERGWNNLVNGTYHVAPSGNQWALVPGSSTIDGLTQQVVIANTYRTSQGAIAETGTFDPSTKKITVTISWTTPRPSQVSSILYLTRYLDNTSNIDTTQTQFNLGTFSTVQSTNTSGGEIILGYNTKGKWCEPHLSSSTIDLPGTPNALYAIEGNIFASTGNTTNASQDSFAHVTVDNSDPPVFSLKGKLRGYKTSAVFGTPNYAYLATSNDTKEVIIVNLNQYSDQPNKIYAESGYFDARVSTSSNSTADADAVYIYENRGYVTAGNYLYVFDAASAATSKPRIGTRIQFALYSSDKAGEIYVRKVGTETYAFISVEGGHPDELEVVNVTNHLNSSQWRVVTQTSGNLGDNRLNIDPGGPGNGGCTDLESGKSVFVKPDGSRAYLGSLNTATLKEFFVINTTTKSNPTIVGGLRTVPNCTDGGGYDTVGMDPNQSVVVSLAENRAIIVGNAVVAEPNPEEYQVLNLTNEANPTKCGGMQFDQGIIGITAVKESDGDSFAYLITGDNSNDLKVVQGGPDGNYVENGVYTSKIFDVGYQTQFNRIEADAVQPGGTELKYQIAITDAVNGSCTNANFVYVGPDGTANTFFPYTGGVIYYDNNGAGYENPGRCFRYKAFFSTTDYNQTPVLNDFKVNFSP